MEIFKTMVAGAQAAVATASGHGSGLATTLSLALRCAFLPPMGNIDTSNAYLASDVQTCVLGENHLLFPPSASILRASPFSYTPLRASSVQPNASPAVPDQSKRGVIVHSLIILHFFLVISFVLLVVQLAPYCCHCMCFLLSFHLLKQVAQVHSFCCHLADLASIAQSNSCSRID
jgi:hypothetical protein